MTCREDAARLEMLRRRDEGQSITTIALVMGRERARVERILHAIDRETDASEGET